MTRVLLVSECCTDIRYEEMLKAGETHLSASQFMFSGLIKGFSECKDVSVTVLSGMRSRGKSGRKFRKRVREYQNGFEFIYPSELKVSGLHFLWSWLRIFMETAKWCAKNKGDSSFVICDALLSCAKTARMAAKLFGVLAVAYVTDLPQHMSEIDERRYGLKKRLYISLISRMTERDMVKYDRYITLTEGLNREANPKHQPHIIVECIMDALPDTEREEQGEEANFVVMFAGKVNRLFGMELLLKAIPLIRQEDIRFHIYGKGNYEEEIIKAAKKDERIVYKGVLPRSEILVKERQADLLINLRPSGYRFAIYSFPSKVAEYMASGTPVLTTRLPGIPAEYEPYLWFLDREEPGGVAEAIVEIMKTPEEERRRRAKAARRFIEEGKNPKRQAQRILSFLTGKELGEAVWST